MAESALQVVDRQAVSVRQSFEPNTIQEALEFAKIISDSELAPKDFRGKPANVMVALQLAKELNVPPMQALAGIAVVNGRATVWGDLMWALVTNHPAFEDAIEESDDVHAKIVLKRRGRSPVTATFTKADAEKAGLWGKAGPWTQYPRRQMQWRARTFAARDLFPDALKGMISAEEAMDYTTTIDALPAAPATQTAGTTNPVAATVETIGQVGGSDFYKIYSSNGWTGGEAATFLAETLGIIAPKNSKDIPVSEWKAKDGNGGGRAWQWANSNSPIKAAVIEKFDLLGFNEEERRDFFKANCGEKKPEMYAKVDVALSAEIDKRNAQEQ